MSKRESKKEREKEKGKETQEKEKEKEKEQAWLTCPLHHNGISISRGQS